MPSPSQTPRSSTGLLWHPTDYLRVLYKRRWVAIPGFLLIFLSGTVNTLRTVPIYEASTQLLIEKDARRATSINSVLQEQETWYGDDFLPTQVRVLQSRSLAERAIDLMGDDKPEIVPEGPSFTLSVGSLVGVVQTAVSGLFGSDTPAPAVPAVQPNGAEAEKAARVARFLGGEIVVPIRASQIVELRFRSPDPDYAQRAANAWATAYRDQVLAFRTNASTEASGYLETQLEQQREELTKAQQRLQDYRANNNAAAVDDRQNVVIAQLDALSQSLNEARFQLVTKEAEYQQMQRLRDSGRPLDSLPRIVSNEYVQSLKQSINQLRSRESQLVAQQFGPEWPELKQVRESLARAEENLGAEVNKIAGALEAEYQAAQQTASQLEADLGRQQAAAMNIDQKAVQYLALEREMMSAQQLYDRLLATVQESSMATEFEGTNIRVVDAAQYPGAPVLPQKRRDIMTAALGGLALALVLAFGFEYFDSRIKSPDEVKAFLQLPFLGMIPNAGGKETMGEAPMLKPDVPPSFAEAIRGLRTAVLFSSADEGARAVIVTSTGPSEGKTVISSSLAISLAQAGQRTLVIDADMRRPRLHEALGRSQEPGLSNVLVGDTGVGDAARQTEEKNLWVLSAGHIPPNPAELLGSRKFADLLADLKRRFDWIVIDAPPVMPVTDAAVLANKSGAVLFVVGSEMTPRQSATAAIEQLRQAQAKFVGVVLNRVNVHRHAYYYSPYYRKEYAKYYQRSANRA